MKWTIKLAILLVPVILASSCRDRKPEAPVDYDQVRKDLMDMNRKKAEQESLRLEEYVKEQSWDAIRTGTGVYVAIYEKQDSTLPVAKNAQLATITYELRLLDGTLCYSTLAEGPETFRIGFDVAESGLHEGIQHMRVGEKAKILIPSFLAHGYTGDQNRIPQDSPIIYDLELLELK